MTTRLTLVSFSCIAVLVVLYPHQAVGITFEALTSSTNPVIPSDVRNAQNVTVTRGSNGMVSFTFRGLPNHETMVVNPNQPAVINYRIDLPENPVPADSHQCLTGGPIGWTIHGVALYNPFNVNGENAVEGETAEIFDECQGHPDNMGQYHYHQLPDNCVFSTKFADYQKHMVHGIARDGFPIYGPYKEDGSLVQDIELDQCNGRCGEDGTYRYHMTKNYPYIMGCFRGTPMAYQRDQTGGGAGGQRPPPPDGGGDGGDRPPPPGGDGGDGGDRPPPPDDGAPPNTGEGYGANKCAYNERAMEFMTCSAYGGGGGGGGGGGANHSQIAMSLLFVTSMVAWMFNLSF